MESGYISIIFLSLWYRIGSSCWGADQQCLIGTGSEQPAVYMVDINDGFLMYQADDSDKQVCAIWIISAAQMWNTLAPQKSVDLNISRKELWCTPKFSGQKLRSMCGTEIFSQQLPMPREYSERLVVFHKTRWVCWRTTELLSFRPFHSPRLCSSPWRPAANGLEENLLRLPSMNTLPGSDVLWPYQK